jgi:hypothetical protein
MMRRRTLLAGALAILALPLHADPAAPVRTVRLLTVGNSFADDACRLLDDIAAADPAVKLIIGNANIGGCSLEKHWTLAEQSGRDPSVKPYRRRSDGRSFSLQELLRSDAWDVVTLQQVSHLSFKPETYAPYLERLAALVRELAPRAKLMIHQTWAYRADAPLLKQEGITQEEMYRRLTEAYAAAAGRLGAGILPSGDAMQRARRAPGKAVVLPDPRFDYENASPPALPDQTNSLIVGWFWQKKEGAAPKLGLDFKHANVRGQYLIAALWYEVLLGGDVRTNAFEPPGIAADDLDFLKETAHETASRPDCVPAAK